MQWPVAAANDADLEIKAANFPGIRLITVPNRGTQEPQKDFHGKLAGLLAAVRAGASRPSDFFFGRQLHQTLGVPIGLINDAWGGSACEAWIPRERLAADAKYKPLLERWERDREELPPGQEGPRRVEGGRREGQGRREDAAARAA